MIFHYTYYIYESIWKLRTVFIKILKTRISIIKYENPAISRTMHFPENLALHEILIIFFLILIKLYLNIVSKAAADFNFLQ